jgi:hypothetical protein
VIFGLAYGGVIPLYTALVRASIMGTIAIGWHHGRSRSPVPAGEKQTSREKQQGEPNLSTRAKLTLGEFNVVAKLKVRSLSM